jgi:hypothetical protein|tara:strand:+ start:975 stop:1145 length:171 start_codon:yes stop_codon:yes gene_type:complete
MTKQPIFTEKDGARLGQSISKLIEHAHVDKHSLCLLEAYSNFCQIALKSIKKSPEQ